MRKSLGIVVLALAACTPDESGDSTSIEAAPQFELVEQSRIGSVNDPNTGFTSISAVDLDADGNVYVYEGRDRQIRVYAPGGQLLRTIGRRGEGPGEFNAYNGFGITGDTVWVLQRNGSSGRKLALFNLQGDLLSTALMEGVRVSLQAERGTGIVMPYGVSDGRFYGRMTTYTTPRPGDPPGPGPNDVVMQPRPHWDMTGRLLDSVGAFPILPTRESAAPPMFEHEGRIILVPSPPSDPQIVVNLPNDVVLVDNTSPASAASARTTITRLDLALDTVWSREFFYAAAPYDEATLSALAWANAAGAGIVRMVDGVAVRQETSGDSGAVYARLRSMMQYPDFQPPFGSHLLTEDGSFWLSRRQDGRSGTENSGSTYIMFGGDGRLTGQIRIPPRLRILRVEDSDLWASVPDDSDIPWLVRYSLKRTDVGR